MSGVWGGESSKETVQCGYCEFVCRKDNLAKHIKRIHGDRSFKWKRVAPINQPSISSFVKTSSEKVDDIVLEQAPPDDHLVAGAKRRRSCDLKYPGSSKQVGLDCQDLHQQLWILSIQHTIKQNRVSFHCPVFLISLMVIFICQIHLPILYRSARIKW